MVTLLRVPKNAREFTVDIDGNPLTYLITKGAIQAIVKGMEKAKETRKRIKMIC